MKTIISTIIFLFLFTIPAFAGDACLYGKAEWKSGSKIDGSTTITTSWNNKKAFPRDGKYELCLGSNPKKTITIYVDGRTYTEIYVDGNTRLNIIRD